MKQLTAKRSVLYLGRMYAPGEALPANNGNMVAAWLKAGSAEWSGAGGEDTDAGATQDSQSGEVLDGHLAATQLETMTKDTLEQLAKDMGVNIPKGAKKAEIVELLTAEPIQIPATEDSGSGQ